LVSGEVRRVPGWLQRLGASIKLKFLPLRLGRDGGTGRRSGLKIYPLVSHFFQCIVKIGV